MIDVYDEMTRVSDRNSLARFLDALAGDYENNSEEWQNLSPGDYFRAIAAYINDSTESIISDADCNSAAKLFYIGKIYE